MNTRKIRPIYYPLTVPHPERLRKWSCKIDYRSAEVIAAGEVSATRYRLPAPAPGAAGKRLAFVSDFHYRGHPKDRKLADLAVERIRAFSPDFLCFGGDLTSDAAELDTQPELLKKFRDCAPVRFAVPGNWERGKSWLPVSFWEELYAEAGIRFLCNAGAEADCFYFHGADDLAGGDPRLPESWPEERAPILLAHRPDTVIALDTCHALDPIALILCGHTHGGQVRFPFLGPVYASSQYGCKLDYGLFERRGGTPRMIVSSGVGNRSLSFRFNCRREVVLVEFA